MFKYILFLAVIAILVLWLVSLYNTLVELRNNRENAFSNIDVQLKLRHDLIPNLVETVKGYATYERDTLQRVIEARSAAIKASSVSEKVQAENNLTHLLSGLKVVLERYPDLKANQGFLQLQSQLSEIEYNLSAVRRFFNSATREYNNAVETFPSNLLASHFGFRRETMFDVGEEERRELDKPAEVKF